MDKGTAGGGGGGKAVTAAAGTGGGGGGGGTDQSVAVRWKVHRSVEDSQVTTSGLTMMVALLSNVWPKRPFKPSSRLLLPLVVLST